MADELRWTFELTRERLAELQLQLEWALQHQNRRFARGLVGERSFEVRKKISVTLLCVAGVLSLIAYTLDPRGIYGAMFAAILVAAVLVAVRPYKPPKQRSVIGTGRRLARMAARPYRKVAAHVPYAIEYAFDGKRVHARATKLGIDRELELRRARLVLHAPDVVLAFRYRWSFTPFRFIYVSDDATRRALLDACERLGVATAPLTGPVEGYVAPIPDVRVVR